MSKKYFLYSCFAILVMLLTSCDNKKEPTGNELAVSMKDDIFELVLHLDQDTYTTDETIICYATLEYIGEEDSIIVYSSDPLIGFGIKDDKYFDGGYAVNDVLIQTTFQKGHIVRYDFTKSGGWDGDDPNAEFYKEYFSDPNLVLPAGTYEISAVIDCALDPNDYLGSNYKKSVTANIEVTE